MFAGEVLLGPDERFIVASSPYSSLGFTFVDLVQPAQPPSSPPRPRSVELGAGVESGPERIGHARELFDRWDADGDGQLTWGEFSTGIEKSPDVKLNLPKSRFDEGVVPTSS